MTDEQQAKVDKILELGFEDVVLFMNYDYTNALIGVTIDGRAVYDYDKMVKCLVDEEGLDELEAIEWIDYNTIRALSYAGENAPIIMYSIEDKGEIV